MAEVKAVRKSRTQGQEIWRRLVKNKGAMIGMAVTIILVILACTVDIIYDYQNDVISQHLTERLQWPSSAHWFGSAER